ncbi:MAG: single-stranded-DNA-specific exonuclease RecJ [Anaerolineae bacterium]|nr:single-stranded-DNA-specific exonuclease RecJ [Anaerolineae bacterium]
MSLWIDPEAVTVTEALRAAVGGHPLVTEALARRGLTDVDAARAFLDPAYYTPASPFELPDMEPAVARVAGAIDQGERIAVWGDFDVDGQTATTLLVTALRDLGADVTYHIPVREKEGHGVNIPVLRRLIDEGVRMVLTCDTGVAAHAAVDFAAARGVDVVITDHHDLPPALPDAHAVVNPARLPAGHALRTLPGVGVAYKLAEALYSRAGRAGDVAQHLDLVALGIVVDVALQTGDTRYLLQRGIEALRRTERPGLLEMMKLADISPAYLTESDIAFGLGPRLNALGRLGDAGVAVEFLTTGDLERARILAAELEGLNARRRMLSDQVYEGALVQIERDPALQADAALVLAHPGWDAGVLGIVASRLVERFHKPAVLIKAPPDGLGRGSARSVEGCDITAAIAAHAAMLAGFGGHPMAAGLSIEPARIDAFRRALSRTVRAQCDALAAEPALRIDAYLPLSELSLDLARALRRLAPFGAGNPPLTLASRDLALSSYRTSTARAGTCCSQWRTPRARRSRCSGSGAMRTPCRRGASTWRTPFRPARIGARCSCRFSGSRRARSRRRTSPRRARRSRWWTVATRLTHKPP